MVGEDDYVCLDIRAVDCSVGHRLFRAKVEVLGTKIWGTQFPCYPRMVYESSSIIKLLLRHTLN